MDAARGQNAHLGTIVARLRRSFEELYGDRLVKLVLYGSQARREAQPHSDIDILVVLEGPVHPGEEIERTGDIVAEFASLASGLLESAAGEGIFI